MNANLKLPILFLIGFLSMMLWFSNAEASSITNTDCNGSESENSGKICYKYQSNPVPNNFSGPSDYAFRDESIFKQAQGSGAELILKGNHSIKPRAYSLICKNPPSPTPPEAVTPEPATIALLGMGLMGMAVWRRKRGPVNVAQQK